MVFRSPKKKGQVSLEFMMAMAAVLMVFLVASYFVYFKITRSLDYKLYLHGSRVTDSIANSVNTINSVGYGYSMDFNLPEVLYGNREYKVLMYEGEPSIFIKTRGFSTGRDLILSTPLSTNYVDCLLDDCFNLCNESNTEKCLNVSQAMNIRVANFEGKIYLTRRYNLNQGNLIKSVVPFIGPAGDLESIYNFANTSVEELIDADGGTVLFLFQEEKSRELSLVVKHHNAGSPQLNFLNYTGYPTVTFSDEPGEFRIDGPLEDPTTFIDGVWVDSNDDPVNRWDGGIFWLNSTGFRVCIEPTVLPGPPARFVWLNPDGVEDLFKNQILCVTYP